MASVNDRVKGNHFDKFCKKSISVNRNGDAYSTYQIGLPGINNSTTITFNGDVGTGNPGDYDYATTNPITIANVTGLVSVNMFGYCSSSIVGTAGAAIKVGVDSNDDLFLPLSSTLTTNFNTGNIIYNGGTTMIGSSAMLGNAQMISEDIKLEAIAANTIAGKIQWLIFWEPITSNGNLTV